MKHFRYSGTLLAALALASITTAASADTFLTVTNGDIVVKMDMDALSVLPRISFETTTIWTEGEISFSGPSLRSVIEQAGITDGQDLVCD